jgi:hypothetical protein
MAEQEKAQSQTAPPTSDADKTRARQWFKKAADVRELRQYDYAIECFINGLGYWPEAVEEGHMPLRSVALQRQQLGGKKPGIMDKMKRSMSGKDLKLNMLNAEHLLSLDPYSPDYADNLLKNAAKGRFLETLQWAAPVVLEALKKDKKPSRQRFQAFREALVEAAEYAAGVNAGAAEAALLTQALESLDYLMARSPGDDALRNELRDLAGRLTIAKGKYDQAEDFRDSLRDADKQKLLHDSERMRQSEESLEALVAAARKDYEANRDTPAKINNYVEMLLKSERKKEEDVAIQVLTDAYGRSRNYSYKQKADDIRLQQLRRKTAVLRAKAKKTGASEDEQQARLAGMEQRETMLEIYRERVEKYPTDLRHKYKLGQALFESAVYDEAIPVLQSAQQDPRYRTRCQLLLGRAFYDKQAPAQAVEVLREALAKYEFTDDMSKELVFWLARSLKAAGKSDEAKEAYGRLLRQDYNYRAGEARKELEELG